MAAFPHQQSLPNEHAPAGAAHSNSTTQFAAMSRAIVEIWDGCLRRMAGVPVRRVLQCGRHVCAGCETLREIRIVGTLRFMAYIRAMKSHPAWQEWETAALAEKWDRARRRA